MEELLTLAAEAADGQRHHLVALQLPVSLVMMTPIARVLNGQGPLPAATGAGLRVMASAPLHGGELPGMVDQEFAGLVRLGLAPAQACVLAVASCPGVADVIIAALKCATLETGGRRRRPTLPELREIAGVLASS